MKVVQAVGWYFPESRGGSEVYVSTLAAELSSLGLGCRVVAPLTGDATAMYQHEGSEVFRYPVPEARTQRQHEGLEPHAGFDDFTRWLAGTGADVYHQHSWTYGCGAHHLRAARALGMRTVLTVHVPGLVCLRGTLMRDGQRPCDARVGVHGCASCWLQQQGMPAPVRQLVACLPPALSGPLRPFGRAGTALSASSLAAGHAGQLLAAAEVADHVVAVCQWLHDALLSRGVPAGKLSLNRQGVAAAMPPARSLRSASAPLRLGFLGRWDPDKGLDVLVRAIRALPPALPVELLVHAVPPQQPHMLAHRREVEALAAEDARIILRDALAPAEVPAFLSGLDLLAVPSRWQETGPLVVLEAFAAGTPVLGSDLGGIAELVHHGRDGWLLPHDDVVAWRDAIAQLVAEPALRVSLREGIGPVRTMSAVAHDTLALYRALLDEER